jgi:hypothetical protein
MIFFFPETKYKRENTLAQYHHHKSQNPTDTDSSGKPNIAIKKTTSDPEQLDPQSSIFGHGCPSTTQRWGLSLRPDKAAIRMIPRDIIIPFRIATYPIVLFASCCVGFAANCLLVLNLLESPGFSRPPYSFAPGSVGFVNFALMAGGIFGLATAGPFSDWISMKLTRRNNGIREPEMRLPSFIPFLIIGFIGMLVAALGWQHLWPWEAVVVVGFGFTGVLVMAIPTIGITYAIDSYKPVTGQIMVVATVVKNTFGVCCILFSPPPPPYIPPFYALEMTRADAKQFGMTYFIEGFAVEKGWVQPIMTLAACGVGIPAIGSVIFWFYGKKMRGWTRSSKVHDF